MKLFCDLMTGREWTHHLVLVLGGVSKSAIRNDYGFLCKSSTNDCKMSSIYKYVHIFQSTVFKIYALVHKGNGVELLKSNDTSLLNFLSDFVRMHSISWKFSWLLDWATRNRNEMHSHTYHHCHCIDVIILATTWTLHCNFSQKWWKLMNWI